MVFCIDTSGSMNTTTEVKGKINLKFGLSEEEITMKSLFNLSPLSIFDKTTEGLNLSEKNELLKNKI